MCINICMKNIPIGQNVISSYSTNVKKQIRRWSGSLSSFNLMILIYILFSATLPLNVRIILLDPFFGRYSSYAICICNHYCRTNQNCCSVMGLTSHFSCLFGAFSSYSVSFFYLPELMSFDELYFFGESYNNGSVSGSTGKFVYSAGNSAGIVNDVEFGNFFPA